jgi:hypothetical protein
MESEKRAGELTPVLQAEEHAFPGVTVNPGENAKVTEVGTLKETVQIPLEEYLKARDQR